MFIIKFKDGTRSKVDSIESCIDAYYISFYINEFPPFYFIESAKIDDIDKIVRLFE